MTGGQLHTALALWSTPGVADQVVTHDDNGHPGGANVLLCTSVDEPILGYIHLLGQEVGGHVSNQQGVHVGGTLELHTLQQAVGDLVLQTVSCTAWLCCAL